jgi:hypothetical protein
MWAGFARKLIMAQSSARERFTTSIFWLTTRIMTRRQLSGSRVHAMDIDAGFAGET